jgi:hypothetical protein
MRAAISPEFDENYQLTGYLRIMARSVHTYPRGRAMGWTTLCGEALRAERTVRRRLLAMALRDCRATYQRMIRDGT